MVERDWTGLYRKGWTGLIVPEAFAHPAKFSRGLIRRIYQHAMAQGWLQTGDLVCDPFGGVALGALHAMQNGLHWIGVELEEKFVELGQQNVALWNARYADHLPAWGSATIRQGDSRRLCEVVGEAAGVVGSPPFGEVQGFHDKEFSDEWGSKQSRTTEPAGYGSTAGNLGNLPAREGDFDAAVGSPPYASRTVHGSSGIDADKLTGTPGPNSQALKMDGYGVTAGQLAALPEGDPREVIDGVCGSPPFEGCMAQARGGGGCLAAENDERYAQLGIVKWKHRQSDYGNSDGQLGQSSGDTFWSASRQIMQQVHTILKPGGVAIWVCKRFVRKKQIVEFSQQWVQLGLACGFEPLEWIRAWLVEGRANVTALFGFEVETKDENGDVTMRPVQVGEPVRYENKQVKERNVERKSFFRRLAESKGSPRIDWEDVIVQRKPAAG